MRTHLSIRLALAAVVAAALSTASAQTKLLRFPDIHGDQIAFSHGGDIWLANVSGGQATRLTSHPGVEVFAKFSPDGKSIAFTGQYDGDEQVYVVPTSGGVPKQLTWYPTGGPRAERWGYDNQVYGWTKDGSRILFRSQRASWTLSQTRLYTVSPKGGSAIPLPMPLAGSGAYSPDGKRIVYSKVFRDFRPEKRYAGGHGELSRDFRLRQQFRQDDQQGSSRRARRDVDRQQDLLQLGQGRDVQPVLVRRSDRRRHAAHAQQDVGRALAERRSGNRQDRV